MTTTAPTSPQAAFLPPSNCWARADTAPGALSDMRELQERTYGQLPGSIPEASTSCPSESRVVRWGVGTEQGQRSQMEDTHQGLVDLEAHLGRDFGSPARSAFFGVYDGHFGSSAAEFARDNLLCELARDANFPHDFAAALKAAYLSVENQLFQRYQSVGGRAAGCTALTALVWSHRLILAHAGDSRAVLCRRGKAIDLTADHKPSSTSERERVYSAGGCTCGDNPSEDSYLCAGLCQRKGSLACSDSAHGAAYENSHLGVTRALGDFHLEKLKYKSPDGLRWQGPLVAEPQLLTHELSDEDEFIILACDGLWDVTSSARAVELARAQLRIHNSPERAAQSLIQYAMERHASDNVTVLIIGLGSSPPPARSFRSAKDRPQLSRMLSSNGLSSLAEALTNAER